MANMVKRFMRLVAAILVLCAVLPTAATAEELSGLSPLGTNIQSSSTRLADIKVSSMAEATWNTIQQDGNGHIFQMAVKAADLEKIPYHEVVWEKDDGSWVLGNTQGVVCWLYGQKKPTATLAAGQRQSAAFFNKAGELLADNVREGHAAPGTQPGYYPGLKVRVVQLQGEDFYRLVVVGQKYTPVDPAPVPPEESKESDHTPDVDPNGRREPVVNSENDHTPDVTEGGRREVKQETKVEETKVEGTDHTPTLSEGGRRR